MALARVCLKNSPLHQSPLMFSLLRSINCFRSGSFETCIKPASISCPYSSSSSLLSSFDEKVDDATAVPKEKDSSSLTKSTSRRNTVWKNPLSLLPFRFGNNVQKISGVGSLSNALAQLPHNLNDLLRSLWPSRQLGQVKEKDDFYKLRFEVPGMSKQDLKITVEDGFLVITGEKKEEEEEEEDEWFLGKYGYYNTSIMLPNDAKVEGIKAEVRDGVLYVNIPRDQEKKREVHEVEIH